MHEKRETVIPLIDVPKISWRALKFKRTKYIIELIDTYGPDILNIVDEIGFFPIHWAVINGLYHFIATYI